MFNIFKKSIPEDIKDLYNFFFDEIVTNFDRKKFAITTTQIKEFTKNSLYVSGSHWVLTYTIDGIIYYINEDSIATRDEDVMGVFRNPVITCSRVKDIPDDLFNEKMVILKLKY